jgi:hypothetical protein
MRKQLVSWQWSLYAEGHHQRANLLIHILTVPLFLAGTVAVAGGVFQPWLFAVGPAAMAAAMALQGRGHKQESTPPVPFQGPLDVVSRIFVEQWVTFPRYVLSGGFGRAWRQSSR